ncbi:3-deoxy-7-phosphoheptulonate synthase [Actinoplanes sp. NPDC049118]|uniref:3-deoxy-7-phosphoheptulonate synthase n=1 Tax=Actinoplanes sp. NPDC049118 TaxID=3155769 RepID=UPI003407C2F3
MSGIERLYVFKPTTPQADLDAWVAHLELHGDETAAHRLGPSPVIVSTGPARPSPATLRLAAPTAVVQSSGGFRLGRRELRPAGTVVSIGPTDVGDGRIAVFAGPCAVEGAEQLGTVAQVVARCGAVGLRGGAFKPRTSPYAFQGMQWSGLALLADVRRSVGLPVLTEVVDPRHVEQVAVVADALQIGARNMQNFELLREAGATGLPVVLKRGFGCTVDEVLSAAEYILAEGNDQVILCERGIRTFEQATRFTLDISAVALMKQRSHLPVMVDPSHSTGVPTLVEPVALAAVAAGADALIIDVHTNPERALCDGKQALLPADFAALMGRMEMLGMGLGRPMSAVGTLAVDEAPATSAIPAR